MKHVQPTQNEHSWPRHKVPFVECRSRELVIRIADWSRQSLETGEPAYDVEVYIGGVYDWNESKSCTVYEYGTKAQAKAQAVVFAQAKVAQLL